MVSWDVYFFGWISGTIQDKLLTYYKENTDSLKDKDTVTDSSELGQSKVIYIFMDEYKPLFWITQKFEYSRVLKTFDSKGRDFDINYNYHLCVENVHMLG